MSDSDNEISAYNKAGLALLAVIFGLLLFALTDAHYRHEQQQLIVAAGSDTGQPTSQLATPRAGLPPQAQAMVSNPEPQGASEVQRRDLAAQEAMSVWTFWAMVWAFLTTAIAGFGLWWIRGTFRETRRAVDETARATRAMLDANDIAELNAQRQLRPYVFPSRAWFEINENGEPVAFIEIRNFGQTPALNKRGWSHTWVECFPLHDPLPDAPADLPMGSAVIGPGATSEAVQPHGGPLNEFSRREIESGRAALYVYGHFTYLDIFGQEHFGRYLYFATGEGALERGRLSAYMDGNSIDIS